MNMPFMVKVPFDLVISLREKLEQVSALHIKEVERLGKRVKMAGASEATIAAQNALKARGKRLTMHCLLRAMIVAGATVLDKKPEEILALMAEDTVRVGRPSRGAHAA